MYTVVIADDEEELRKAIIERVDWAGAGFNVIGDAENGIEALEIVERLEPDLLITDVKMPLMTGLELAHNVREIRPATQMVILSGYDDFEYAREAIQYNILSYLLKPISAEELTKSLCEIKEKMDKRFENIRRGEESTVEPPEQKLDLAEFLLPLLLGTTGDAEDDGELKKKAEELKLVKPEGQLNYCVIVSKYKNLQDENSSDESHLGFVNGAFKNHFKVESFFINSRIVTIVFSDNSGILSDLQLPLLEMVQNSERVLNEKCTVGLSRVCNRLSQCSTAYFEAVTARRYTSDGAGNIRFIGDQEHGNSADFDYVEKILMTLEQLLKVGSKSELLHFLGDVYSNSMHRNFNYLLIQMLAAVYKTVSTASQKEALSEFMESNPIYSKISFYDSEKNIQKSLTDLCLNAREIIMRYQKHDTEVLCDKVIEIIENEYQNEDLSLTEVSSRLAVSPNYLSALIKKTKKENFVNLVTQKRMKSAYDMLICSAMRIIEIAQACGYSDQHYFSYCFKKYYGISPNKMRERDRGSEK